MEKLFTMSEKEITFYHGLLKVAEKQMSQVKAAELLGITDRHFRRLWKAYKAEGVAGILSKRRGKPSNNRLPDKLRQQIIDLLKTRYSGFGPTLAKEKLQEEYRIKISLETLRQIMISQQLWEGRKRKRLKLYQSRQRRAHKGELIQLDGSPHAWFEERGPACCLLGFIDDATSSIMHLKFVISESTATYFKALEEYLIKHGKPCSYYTDRFTVFRVNNDKADYRGSGLTQVGRALKELGIELICANSPQAKGRVERLFNTLQDRLVKELRLKGINTLEEANAYLPEYIAKHNAQFSVKAQAKEDLHEKIEIEKIKGAFCYKEERTLSKNLELSYNSRILQIITDNPTYAMRRAKVQVVEDLEGKIEIEYHGKKLKYKELLVRDHQGRIMNRKEITQDTKPVKRGIGANS